MNMSSTSPRQGLSKTLRSIKARFVVVFTLVLLAAVFSASALTANLNGPVGQQAGSFAATMFSMFSGGSPKAEQPAAVAASSDDPLVLRPIANLTKGGNDLIDAPAIAYSNPAAITINDGTTASPYPSNITVAGFPGSVAKVTVTLNGLTHTFPDDVDVLLVGPSGQMSVLMSDVGGGDDVAGLTFTLDDTAINSLPDSVTFGAGTYKPTNSGVGDPFGAPAPAAGSSSSSPLSVFNGTNPNGTWSLYVVDDAGGDVGSFAGGWSMEITPGPCAAPPANMVAWYPGQVNTNDIIGDPANNGAAQGALGYTPGKVGNAFSLLGAANVQIPSSAGLNVGTGPGLTIDGWFNVANTTAPMPIIEWNDGTGAGLNNGIGVHVWANFPNPGQLYINVVDTAGNQHSQFVNSPLIVAGTMNYFAWSVNKTTGAVDVQLNGGFGSGFLSGSAPFTPLTSSSVYLGRRPAGGNPAGSTGYFTGILDEIEIYNRALTPTETNSIFLADANGKCHVSQIQFSTASQLIGESSGSTTVTLKRIGANDTTASVDFFTADGTANAPGDYTSVVIPTVTFAPGERNQSVTVNINDDAIDEPDETFTANISQVTGVGASLGAPIQHTVTIQDNDNIPNFTINNAQGIEGTPPGAGGSATFTVTKTGQTVFPSSVSVQPTSGTATGGASCSAGIDFINTATVLNFPASLTVDTQTVTVNFCPDSAIEGDENFTMVMTPTGATAGAAGTGTIQDDDSSVQFTAAGYNDTEGNTARPATKNFAVQVSRTGTGSGLPAATIDLSTIGAATATGGFLNCNATTSDFIIVSGTTISWAAGDNATKTFNFQVCQDTIIENNENFSGQLSNPINTQIGAQGTTLVTINNDDGAAIFNFNPTSSVTQAEGTVFAFNVVRTFPAGTTGTDLASTVNYTIAGTSGLPATPGTDVDASGSVNFPVGGSNTVATVINTNNDTIFEPTEQFTATLSSVSGDGALGANLTRVGNITDNDPRPVFQIRANRTQVEGNAGTTAMIFDIDKISGDAQYPQTVRVTTADGGGPTAATAPSDYTAIPGPGDPVVFGQGQLTGQFAVIINGDTVFEDDETFTTTIASVSIANDSPVNCASCIGSPASRTGTITNDDTAPVFDLQADVTVTEGSGAGTTVATFTITKTGATELTSIVSANTVDGTAVAPGDYTAIVNAAVATFAPADTSKTFNVNIVRDTIRENTESYTVNLSNVTNGTFGTVTRTGNITDDEPNPNFSIANVSAAEGSPAVFTVTRSFPAGLTGMEVNSTLTCTTANISGNTTIHAQAGSDYTSFNSGITFLPADATKTCSVSTTSDTVFEGDETFNMGLTAGSFVGTITGQPAVGTITNNDACSFAVSNVTQNEGNAGTSNFNHVVTKTCDTGTFNAFVSYDSTDGTATAPSDYTEILPGTLAFLPAETTKPMPVSVNGDLLVETNETYNVRLTGATVNGVPVTSLTNGLGTIVNDDGVPITISGTITNFSPAGPLAGVSVCLTGSAAPPCVLTNAAGQYSFAGLPSGGNYLITPTLAGKVMSPTTRTYTGISADVTNANFVAYDTGNIPRTLNLVNAYAVPGSPVTQNITLTAQGDEASLSFSVNYNSAILSAPTVACGVDSGAGCTLTANTGTPGVIGVSVDPQGGGTWAAGTRIVVTVTYNTAPTAAPNTPVTFGDAPTLRRTSDSGSNPLPTVYNNGMIVFQQGLEADVATRNSGDGSVLPGDVVQVRRFVTALDTPNPAFNEFQRADSAPAGTKGDGQLNASDVIQARRYSAVLDPTQTAGGPFVAIPPAPAPEASVVEDNGAKTGRRAVANVGRILRALNATGSVTQQVNVCVEIDSQGDEAAIQTTINFDPAKLAISGISSPGVNPDVTLGTGVAGGTSLTVNGTQVGAGRIGWLIDSANNLALGTRQIVCLRFTIIGGAGTTTPITFGNAPVPTSISDNLGNPLTATNENGVVTILGPTAAGVSVSGRVMAPNGAGLRGATVTLIDNAGVRRTATTSTFGYYQFDDVEAGDTYIVGVTSRRYRFAPRTVQVLDTLTDVDFTGQE